MATAVKSRRKRSLKKARSTDDTSSQQYGSLSVILNVPGLNTHLLSFSSATDLSRLSQCNRALKSMIDESFDLELERDVHLLQQMDIPSEKIAQFREEWPRLKSGKARIVCYHYDVNGEMMEGDADNHLDFAHESVVNLMRQFVNNHYYLWYNLEAQSVQKQMNCVECGIPRDPEESSFIPSNLSGSSPSSSSNSQFKCRDCFRSRDSGLILMLKHPEGWFGWDVSQQGPFDSTVGGWEKECLDDPWTQDSPSHLFVMQRMEQKTGLWLVDLWYSDGPSAGAIFWFVRLENTE